MNARNDLDLMSGLMAYDAGFTDSGIHDEAAKADLFSRFHSEVTKTDKEPAVIVDYATWLLSDEGKEQGYTLEDVANFLRWLADNGYDL